MLDRKGMTMNHKRLYRIYNEEGLAVIDKCCRENLCLIADTGLSVVRIAQELDALIWICGKPGRIVSERDLVRL